MDSLRDLDGRPAPEANSKLTERELRQDNEFLRDMIRDLQRQLEEANATNKRNSEQLAKLYDLIESDREEKQKLLAIIEKLESQLAENKKMRFGRKSVKGIEQKPETRGRHDDKDEHDGTSGSLVINEDEAVEESPQRQSKGNGHKGRHRE